MTQDDHGIPLWQGIICSGALRLDSFGPGKGLLLDENLPQSVDERTYAGRSYHSAPVKLLTVFIITI